MNPRAPASAGTITIEIYRGEDVSEAQVQSIVDAATPLLQSMGIRLDIAQSHTVAAAEPFAGRTRSQTGAALDAALAPVRSFVATHVADTRGTVRVWIVGRIAAPDSVVRRVVGSRALHAYTFGPEEGLLGDARPAQDPVVVLSVHPQERATGRTLVHELGHVAGLSHRDDDGSALMHPSSTVCPVTLRPQERAAFARFGEAQHSVQRSIAPW